MVKKLWYRLCMTLVLALSLTGCNIIQDLGNTLANSFKGISIHFP